MVKRVSKKARRYSRGPFLPPGVVDKKLYQILSGKNHRVGQARSIVAARRGARRAVQRGSKNVRIMRAGKSFPLVLASKKRSSKHRTSKKRASKKRTSRKTTRRSSKKRASKKRTSRRR